MSGLTLSSPYKHMRDQSFNPATMKAVLRKSDFFRHPILNIQKEMQLKAAAQLANECFEQTNPLESISVRGRIVHRPLDLQRTLIIRQLYYNVRYAVQAQSSGRKHILRNVGSLLAEGVPYRVYKRDVRKFYESFQADMLRKHIAKLALSEQSKRLTISVLDHHYAAGFKGLPIGLNLSSLLSEALMQDFDTYVRGHSDVHYYARYVDDILVITSGTESQHRFEHELVQTLPAGLHFSRTKSHCKHTLTPYAPAIDLSFLGSRFHVSTGNKEQLEKSGRDILIGISFNKTCKVKTRITRSFISYSKTGDYTLLESRIRFLTSNLSLPKAGSSVRQLVGLSCMYPDMNSTKELEELDSYLRRTILSSKGRSFSKYHLSRKNKNRLLSYSFLRGHRDKRFFHFSHQAIGEIQRCWSLEN